VRAPLGLFLAEIDRRK